METSRESQLPVWEVTTFHIQEPAGSYDMLQIICPRCSAEAWVRRSWCALTRVKGRDEDPPALVFGRVCPSCAMTSAVPEGLRIVPPSEAPRRRIVRRRSKSN